MKRKIRKGPLIICSILGVSCVLIISILTYKLFLDPYKDYKKYDEETKKYGTVQHINEKEKNKFVSIFYPETENENLNQITKNKIDAFLNQKTKDANKQILYMDYEADCIYNQYAVIKYQMKKIINNEESETLSIVSYDLKNDKQLTLKDCLRGDYSTLLNKEGIKKYSKDSTNIEIQEHQFIYYTDDNLTKKIDIEYEKNKDYIKLANKNIPSYAPLDIKKTNTMSIDSNRKMVAITLDDGPHTSRTQQAMDLFEKYSGRGTFFQLGRNMNYYPEIVKEVYERGHEIASHTYNHKNLAIENEKVIEDEIATTQDTCFKICGFEPELIRPPYGSKNDKVKNMFEKYNLKMILWDGDTLDWRYSKHSDGAKIICNNIIRDAKKNGGDGNIVLIHDIHQNTIDGLAMALEKLNEEGYQFVTVSDLLKTKGHSDYK